MKVCCFSGGRGAQKILDALSKTPNIELSVIINGYDDGKSTGEIRRLVPSFLGPSDFRKVLSNILPIFSHSQFSLSRLLELRVNSQSEIIDNSILHTLLSHEQFNCLFNSVDRVAKEKLELYLNSSLNIFKKKIN